MTRRRGTKQLLVGSVAYYRSSGHRHSRVRDEQGRSRLEDCREVVRLARVDGPGTGLRIVFRPKPGHLVCDGMLHDGGVVRAEDDVYLNLHRPAVIRALLDAATDQGWDTPRELELDGWTLLDAALARLRPGPGIGSCGVS